MTHTLTNDELERAIRMTHTLLQTTSGSSELYAKLDGHLRELLDLQMKRARKTS